MVEKNLIYIETQYGFVESYPSDALVLHVDFLKDQQNIINLEPEFTYEKRGKEKKQRKTLKKRGDILVVDLHIEQLIENSKDLLPMQIIEKQTDKVIHTLEEALNKDKRNLVFIHGIGQGRLKQILYDILDRYREVEYYDASYRKYGSGATEVRIIPSKK